MPYIFFALLWAAAAKDTGQARLFRLAVTPEGGSASAMQPESLSQSETMLRQSLVRKRSPPQHGSMLEERKEEANGRKGRRRRRSRRREEVGRRRSRRRRGRRRQEGGEATGGGAAGGGGGAAGGGATGGGENEATGGGPSVVATGGGEYYPDCGNFISMYVRRRDQLKKCAGVKGGENQTNFPFTWGTLTAQTIIDPQKDKSTYQNDLVPESPPSNGKEEKWWDMRKKPDGEDGEMLGWIEKTFYEKNPPLVPLVMTCSFKFGSKSYKVRVRGNPNDFTSYADLKSKVTPFLESIGRGPQLLFKNFKQLTVNGGGEGGASAAPLEGDVNFNIEGQKMEHFGEKMFHELTHLSVQGVVNSDEYQEAVKNDCYEFYSTYAQGNPQREGIAESFLLYWALHYKPDRLTDQQKQDIQRVGPNRLEFFCKSITKEGELIVPPFAE